MSTYLEWGTLSEHFEDLILQVSNFSPGNYYDISGLSSDETFSFRNFYYCTISVESWLNNIVWLSDFRGFCVIFSSSFRLPNPFLPERVFYKLQNLALDPLYELGLMSKWFKYLLKTENQSEAEKVFRRMHYHWLTRTPPLAMAKEGLLIGTFDRNV